MLSENLSQTELSTITGYNQAAEHIHGTIRDIDADEHLMRFLYLLESGISLIDIGCGSGKALPLLRNAGIGKYVGIDASEHMISIAKQRYKGEHFHHLDARSLSKLFQPDAFDSFFAYNSLMHVPYEFFGDTLSSIHSIVRKGAVGFVNVPWGKGVFISETCGPIALQSRITTHRWDEIDFMLAFSNAGFKHLDSHICRGCQSVIAIVMKE